MTPRPGPAMPVVPVRLSGELLARLDAIAERDGLTRSDVIRAAIERYVKRKDKA